MPDIAVEIDRGPDAGNVYVNAGPITGSRRALIRNRPEWADHLAKTDATFPDKA